MKPDLIKQLAVTYELCSGRMLSDGAMNAIVDEFDRHDPGDVSKALTRCMLECKGYISPADIISRIIEQDGRPSPDEAWALVPKSEDDSVCWTKEMSESYGVCRHLFPDMVAARMAFLSAYRERLQDARTSGKNVNWQMSLGHRRDERKDCLKTAVLDGKISASYALSLCPGIDPRLLVAPEERKMLPEPEEINRPSPEEFRKLLDGLTKKVGI